MDLEDIDKAIRKMRWIMFDSKGADVVGTKIGGEYHVLCDPQVRTVQGREHLAIRRKMKELGFKREYLQLRKYYFIDAWFKLSKVTHNRYQGIIAYLHNKRIVTRVITSNGRPLNKHSIVAHSEPKMVPMHGLRFLARYTGELHPDDPVFIPAPLNVVTVIRHEIDFDVNDIPVELVGDTSGTSMTMTFKVTLKAP